MTKIFASSRHLKCLFLPLQSLKTLHTQSRVSDWLVCRVTCRAKSHQGRSRLYIELKLQTLNLQILIYIVLLLLFCLNMSLFMNKDIFRNVVLRSVFLLFVLPHHKMLEEHVKNIKDIGVGLQEQMMKKKLLFIYFCFHQQKTSQNQLFFVVKLQKLQELHKQLLLSIQPPHVFKSLQRVVSTVKNKRISSFSQYQPS